MDPATMRSANPAGKSILFSAPVAKRGRRLLLPTARPVPVQTKAPWARTADRVLHRWQVSAIETLWLTAALVVPLAFSPWGENAFELPKALILRAIVLLMVLVTLLRFVDGGLRHPPTHRPSPWLVLPALAFGLAQIAATAFSINPRASLWGSYERQQGLLTLFSYLACFFFTAANLRTRAQVDRLLTTLIWGSAPVLLYGFAQALGWDPLAWQTDAASPVLSTVGRSNFLGSYLTLLIPLTMGSLVWTRRWPTLLLLVGQFVCLALTQARGAWIGLGVGAFAFALAWAIAGRNKTRTRIVVALAGAALAFSMVALVNLPSSPLEAWARIPGLDRLAGIVHTSEGSSAARLTIWQATLPLAAARPWLGYGPETMRVVFGPVFPPQLVYYQGRNVPVDRAHNLWLDSAMSSGVVGLAAFVALLAGWAWVAWRGLRDARDRWEMAVWSALIGAVAGHVADLQFGFDLTTGATVFWLILAMAAALPLPNLSQSAACIAQPAPGQRDWSGWLAYALPAGAVFILIGLICVRPLLADGAYWNSRQATESQMQVQAERAVEWWPVEPRYRAGLAEVYMAHGDPIAAERQLSMADQLSPNDPQIWSARGSLYALWGEREPRRYLQAETSFRRALELAPNVATTHTALGLVLTRQGRLDEGLAELERAVALDATDGVAFRHLADLYQMLGRQSESTWARKEANRWGGQ